MKNYPVGVGRFIPLTIADELEGIRLGGQVPANGRVDEVGAGEPSNVAGQLVWSLGPGGAVETGLAESRLVRDAPRPPVAPTMRTGGILGGDGELGL